MFCLGFCLGFGINEDVSSENKKNYIQYYSLMTQDSYVPTSYMGKVGDAKGGGL